MAFTNKLLNSSDSNVFKISAAIGLFAGLTSSAIYYLVTKNS